MWPLKHFPFFAVSVKYLYVFSVYVIAIFILFKQRYQFKSIRVDFVEQILVNEKAPAPHHAVRASIRAQHKPWWFSLLPFRTSFCNYFSVYISFIFYGHVLCGRLPAVWYSFELWGFLSSWCTRVVFLVVWVIVSLPSVLAGKGVGRCQCMHPVHSCPGFVPWYQHQVIMGFRKKKPECLHCPPSWINWAVRRCNNSWC